MAYGRGSPNRGQGSFRGRAIRGRRPPMRMADRIRQQQLQQQQQQQQQQAYHPPLPEPYRNQQVPQQQHLPQYQPPPNMRVLQQQHLPQQQQQQYRPSMLPNHGWATLQRGAPPPMRGTVYGLPRGRGGGRAAQLPQQHQAKQATSKARRGRGAASRPPASRFVTIAPPAPRRLPPPSSNVGYVAPPKKAAAPKKPSPTKENQAPVTKKPTTPPQVAARKVVTPSKPSQVSGVPVKATPTKTPAVAAAAAASTAPTPTAAASQKATPPAARKSASASAKIVAAMRARRGRGGGRLGGGGVSPASASSTTSGAASIKVKSFEEIMAEKRAMKAKEKSAANAKQKLEELRKKALKSMSTKNKTAGTSQARKPSPIASAGTSLTKKSPTASAGTSLTKKSPTAAAGTSFTKKKSPTATAVAGTSLTKKKPPTAAAGTSQMKRKSTATAVTGTSQVKKTPTPAAGASQATRKPTPTASQVKRKSTPTPTAPVVKKVPPKKPLSAPTAPAQRKAVAPRPRQGAPKAAQRVPKKLPTAKISSVKPKPNLAKAVPPGTSASTAQSKTASKTPTTAPTSKPALSSQPTPKATQKPAAPVRRPGTVNRPPTTTGDPGVAVKPAGSPSVLSASNKGITPSVLTSTSVSSPASASVGSVFATTVSTPTPGLSAFGSGIAISSSASSSTLSSSAGMTGSLSSGSIFSQGTPASTGSALAHVSSTSIAAATTTAAPTRKRRLASKRPGLFAEPAYPSEADESDDSDSEPVIPSGKLEVQDGDVEMESPPPPPLPRGENAFSFPSTGNGLGNAPAKSAGVSAPANSASISARGGLAKAPVGVSARSGLGKAPAGVSARSSGLGKAPAKHPAAATRVVIDLSDSPRSTTRDLHADKVSVKKEPVAANDIVREREDASDAPPTGPFETTQIDNRMVDEGALSSSSRNMFSSLTVPVPGAASAAGSQSSAAESPPAPLPSPPASHPLLPSLTTQVSMVLPEDLDGDGSLSESVSDNQRNGVAIGSSRIPIEIGDAVDFPGGKDDDTAPHVNVGMDLHIETGGLGMPTPTSRVFTRQLSSESAAGTGVMESVGDSEAPVDASDANDKPTIENGSGYALFGLSDDAPAQNFETPASEERTADQTPALPSALASPRGDGVKKAKSVRFVGLPDDDSTDLARAPSFLEEDVDSRGGGGQVATVDIAHAPGGHTHQSSISVSALRRSGGMTLPGRRVRAEAFVPRTATSISTKDLSELRANSMGVLSQDDTQDSNKSDLDDVLDDESNLPPPNPNSHNHTVPDNDTTDLASFADTHRSATDSAVLPASLFAFPGAAPKAAHMRQQPVLVATRMLNESSVSGSKLSTSFNYLLPSSGLGPIDDDEDDEEDEEGVAAKRSDPDADSGFKVPRDVLDDASPAPKGDAEDSRLPPPLPKSSPLASASPLLFAIDGHSLASSDLGPELPPEEMSSSPLPIGPMLPPSSHTSASSSSSSMMAHIFVPDTSVKAPNVTTRHPLPRSPNGNGNPVQPSKSKKRSRDESSCDNDGVSTKSRKVNGVPDARSNAASNHDDTEVAASVSTANSSTGTNSRKRKMSDDDVVEEEVLQAPTKRPRVTTFRSLLQAPDTAASTSSGPSPPVPLNSSEKDTEGDTNMAPAASEGPSESSSPPVEKEWWETLSMGELMSLSEEKRQSIPIREPADELLREGTFFPRLCATYNQRFERGELPTSIVRYHVSIGAPAKMVQTAIARGLVNTSDVRGFYTRLPSWNKEVFSHYASA